MAVSSFVTALNNDQQELFVYQKDPANVEEAGKAAMAYETFRASRAKTTAPMMMRQQIAASKSMEGSQSEFDLENLIKRLERQGFIRRLPQQPGATSGPGTSRRFQGECFHCKKPGHKKQDCYAWQRQVRRREQEQERPQARQDTADVAEVRDTAAMETQPVAEGNGQ